MNKTQVIKDLNKGKMKTTMLPVLSKIGFNFEYFLRYAQLDKFTQWKVRANLINELKEGLK